VSCELPHHAISLNPTRKVPTNVNFARVYITRSQMSDETLSAEAIRYYF